MAIILVANTTVLRDTRVTLVEYAQKYVLAVIQDGETTRMGAWVQIIGATTVLAFSVAVGCMMTVVRAVPARAGTLAGTMAGHGGLPVVAVAQTVV